jgi:hypothetical protein
LAGLFNHIRAKTVCNLNFDHVGKALCCLLTFSCEPEVLSHFSKDFGILTNLYRILL